MIARRDTRELDTAKPRPSSASGFAEASSSSGPTPTSIVETRKKGEWVSSRSGPAPIEWLDIAALLLSDAATDMHGSGFSPASPPGAWIWHTQEHAGSLTEPVPRHQMEQANLRRPPSPEALGMLVAALNMHEPGLAAAIADQISPAWLRSKQFRLDRAKFWRSYGDEVDSRSRPGSGEGRLTPTVSTPGRTSIRLANPPAATGLHLAYSWPQATTLRPRSIPSSLGRKRVGMFDFAEVEVGAATPASTSPDRLAWRHPVCHTATGLALLRVSQLFQRPRPRRNEALQRQVIDSIRADIAVVTSLPFDDFLGVIGACDMDQEHEHHSVDRFRVTLLLERMDVGTLDSIVTATGAVPERVCGRVAFKICRGLQHLRERFGKAHRHLEPEEVWVSSAGEIKLCWMNIAPAFAASSGKIRLKKLYVAPEQIRGGFAESHASDIWSLGVTLVECLEAKYPFPTRCCFEVISSIANGPAPRLGDGVSLDGVRASGVGASAFSTEARDFVAQCCVKNPTERAGLELLGQHPWLTATADADAEVRDWARSVQCSI